MNITIREYQKQDFNPLRRLSENFYLFTDTSCNYGFYEHQGMVRRCEKEHVFYIDYDVATW